MNVPWAYNVHLLHLNVSQTDFFFSFKGKFSVIQQLQFTANKLPTSLFSGKNSAKPHPTLFLNVCWIRMKLAARTGIGQGLMDQYSSQASKRLEVAKPWVQLSLSVLRCQNTSDIMRAISVCKICPFNQQDWMKRGHGAAKESCCWEQKHADKRMHTQPCKHGTDGSNPNLLISYFTI